MREAQPIHWSPMSTPSTWEHLNQQAARGAPRTAGVDEHGRKVMERLPPTCHQGDYESRAPHPRARSRFVTAVRHDGHVVAVVLTNAAAHLDLSSGYTAHVNRKARFFGWFAFRGCCPVIEIRAKRLRRDRVHAPELLDRRARACDRKRLLSDTPCPHAILERDARRAVHEAEHERLIAPHLRAAREMAAKEERRDATLDKLADVVQMLAAKNPAPSKTPRKGR